MDDMTNDDHRTAEKTSEDRPTNGASPPGGMESLGEDAGAASVVPSGSADVVPDLASARGTPAETEKDERHTKAQLIEYGRMLVKIKKAARRKARERAAKEKAEGLLTITFKCHKDNRRLVMGAVKKLLITVEDMRGANLDPAPLEAGLHKLLRDYYGTHVSGHVKTKKS